VHLILGAISIVMLGIYGEKLGWEFDPNSSLDEYTPLFWHLVYLTILAVNSVL
jgi:hypothetical protein